MTMRKFENSFTLTPWAVLCFSIAAFFSATSATAGIHTWDVVEVFSNSDGTIQYIELLDVGTGGTETGVGNGSLTSNSQSFSWSQGAVVGPTNGRRYLIATAAFAALPGAPTPDVIIPPANVPFFSAAGDTVSFNGQDSLPFPAGVPTNGLDSFDESAGVATNSPENYAGTTGSVDASGAPGVPSASAMILVLLLASLIAIGIYALSARRGPSTL